MALGATIGYQQLGYLYHNDASGNNFSEKESLTTSAIELKLLGSESGLVQGYTLLGFGGTLEHLHESVLPNVTSWISASDFKSKFYNFQASYGIRIGRELAGFLELGIGYKGFANFGISYCPRKARGRKW